MPEFNRFDICEAHLILEWDYNVSGWLQQRPSNVRRGESTDVQLRRIGFKPSPMLGGFDDLSENGQEIYREAVERLGLPPGDD